MSAVTIYVVVTSDDLMGKYKTQALQEDPQRKDCPIVWETQVTGCTLEREQQRAAQLEAQGYGACRVARLVFEDHPAFYERRDICTEGDCIYNGQTRPSTCACSKAGA